jgi:hypothetical protein
MGKNMIAACGIDCAKCDAYVGTMRNDLAALAALAEKWSKEYNFAFTAEAVQCHGCSAADGVQIGHCAQCGVRLCAVGKGYVTCAECPEYACEKLSAFNKAIPGAKDNLDALRASP